MKKIALIIGALLLLFSFSQENVYAASYDKATTAKKVKVYAGAATSERVRFTIPKGKAVKVIGGESVGWDQYDKILAEQFGFYRVSYKGKTGWIIQGSLKFKNPYKWVPGIKQQAIEYVDYYADGDPYKMVKSGVSDTTEGYYIVFAKWYRIGYVNCKTGYASSL